jgi:nucleotidyltransferase substrate binding protein (TIGR01987 family)
MEVDIRWVQRFENYKKAHSRVEGLVQLSLTRGLNDTEKLALIKCFELTFELAWNVMKDYLSGMGITGIIGSKGAIRGAFSNDLLDDGQLWMKMIESRNDATHTYNEEIAEEIVKEIIEHYYKAFVQFLQKMTTLLAAENTEC